MSLLGISNELLLLIAKDLNKASVNALHQTNLFFSKLLTPLLYKFPAVANDGRTPVLCWAAHRGYMGLVRRLLENGVDANNPTGSHQYLMTEGTAISHAVRRGDEAMVRLLLKHGAYPDPEVSPFRDTVLATAVKGNHETIARLLLEHGADIDAGCGQRPPPLHVRTPRNGKTVI